MASKLLYVVNHPEFFLSHRLPLARAARREGYEVHVATSETPRAGEIADYGLQWHRLPLSPGGRSPVKDVRLYRHLVRLYRQLQPDIIHHVTIKPVMYGSLAARKAGVPAVVNAFTGLGHLFTAPGLADRMLNRFILRLLRQGFRHPNTRLILQNPDDRSLFSGHGIIDEARIALVRGSGVDVNHFRPAGEPDGPVCKVLLASRLLWNKGVGEFVEAAKMVRSSGYRARFLLAGAPDANNPLSIDEAQLRQWHRSGVVEWLGHRSDMQELLAGSHIVVLPSYYGEGVPKVLIEAAACGRPIVTTDMPGCREIVREHENGLLVPPRDSSRLAEAIQTLLKDPGLRRRMGEQGRHIAVAGYSLQQVSRQTLDIYERMLNG